MECSEIHLFSCCLLASWQLDRALCLHVLRAWTSGPVYKNWSQASAWEIQNSPIFRMWIAWSCSKAPLALPVSGCCIDPTRGWGWRTCPFLHSPTGTAHSCFTSVSSSSSFWITLLRWARVPAKPSKRSGGDGVCVLETDGLLVLCSTKPTVPGVWKLSAFWSHPPCAGLKCFLVAEEHGNADQAALEADKKNCLLLGFFWGEKRDWTVFKFWAWTFVVEQRKPLVIGTISLWEHNQCSNNKIGINKKGFILLMLSGKASCHLSGQGMNRHILN